MQLFCDSVALAMAIFVEQYPPLLEGSSYADKTDGILYINDILRNLGLTFLHPETDEPCNLYAVPSRDGHGRFTLENRKTKVRTGGYKSFQELIPFKLVPTPPRKEGVIERRKESRKQSPYGNEDEQTDD